MPRNKQRYDISIGNDVIAENVTVAELTEITGCKWMNKYISKVLAKDGRYKEFTISAHKRKQTKPKGTDTAKAIGLFGKENYDAWLYLHQRYGSVNNG